MTSKQKEISNVMYPQEERERIGKIIEFGQKLEEFLEGEKEKWNKEIQPLFEQIKEKFTIDNAQVVIDTQTSALAYRQNISDRISYWLNKRSKEDIKIKMVKQERLLFYSVGFGYEPKLSEKAALIDAHLAENQRIIELYDSHVDFLRATAKNLESLGFAIKNIIELMSILGR
jgi:2C-methyl-D-erythritol 2,4-cyclodiphosphate synthase